MSIDLREFYFSNRHDEILPSKGGIALTFQELNVLKDSIPEILELFPILNSVLLCRDNPTHSNLEKALQCRQCNYFNDD